MSYSSRPLPPHLRHPSASSVSNGSGQSPVLLARIKEKQLELENLRQLRDLSAGLAGQMQILEEKLATLADGTEGTAVMSNWHNVLRAIHMASTAMPKLGVEDRAQTGDDAVKQDPAVPLPQTLVRIPTQQVPSLQQAKSAEGYD
ncbi:hypothetical protein B0A49_10056 [Cryomyces minteri]|uniref:DASH complex subunit DAD2 n=1 Tax=Cryomyces minteri TaxID=331657 RepID=A0A4U0VYL1_9PEZI|nr:hypothetical protein B0A49_10056 [Cryomyces minteri]